MKPVSRWFAPVLIVFLALPAVGLAGIPLGQGGEPGFILMASAPLPLAAAFAVAFRRRPTALKWLFAGVLVSTAFIGGVAYAVVGQLGTAVQAAANAPPGPGVGLAPDLAPTVTVVGGTIGIVTTLFVAWLALMLAVGLSILVAHLSDRSR